MFSTAETAHDTAIACANFQETFFFSRRKLTRQYAKQISSAVTEIENLAVETDRQFLSIGANTGVHQFTLKNFYQDFIIHHPSICLGLHTYHSSDIYNYVSSGRFELGIVSNAKKNA